MPIPCPTPTPTPAPVNGQTLYNAYCMGCHGNPRTSGPTPASQIKVAGARSCSINGAIKGNALFRNGIPAMQFLKGMLTSADIDKISGYLNSFSVTGQQRYLSMCSTCHGLDARGGLTGESVRGASAGEIGKAIGGEKEMRYLSCIPAPDRSAIGDYLRGVKKGGGGHDDDHD